MVSTDLCKEISNSDNTNVNRPPKEKWIGEIGIPASWIEGGTRTYEKTGSAPPKSNGNLFTMEISYHTANGNNCTARFNSQDVFHWYITSDTKM